MENSRFVGRPGALQLALIFYPLLRNVQSVTVPSSFSMGPGSHETEPAQPWAGLRWCGAALDGLGDRLTGLEQRVDERRHER